MDKDIQILSDRLARLEKIVLGTVESEDNTEYRLAIYQLARGNRKPFETYLEKGGKIKELKNV